MNKKLFALAVAAGISLGGSAADTAQFPGGQEALQTYITENLRYPTTAKENGIEGNVELEFIVKADGSISSVKVLRMIDPDLEAEAIRLVTSMPKWQPADSGDSTVKLTVPFRL